MKRLVLIAAGVLVPFAALVAWGLSALQHEPVALPPVVAEAPAPAPAPIEHQPPSRPEPAPVPAPAPFAQPAAAPAPAPEPLPAPGTPEAENVARTAVLNQLTPMIEQCFYDMNPKLRAQMRVNAMFNTQNDGTLSSVRLKMKAADPYLMACVQDALEGAHLDLSKGVPNGEMRHTFAFNPDSKK